MSLFITFMLPELCVYCCLFVTLICFTFNLLNVNSVKLYGRQVVLMNMSKLESWMCPLNFLIILKHYGSKKRFIPDANGSVIRIPL